MLTLTFKRRHVVLLSVCAALLCGLLVCAGYLLGYGRAAAVKPSEALGPQTTPAGTGPQLPAAPANPANDPGMATASPASATPAAISGSTPAGPESPAKEEASTASAPQSSASPAPAAKAEPVRAPKAQATASPPAVTPTAPRYTLQFGTFDEKPGAEAKIKALKDSSVKAELFAGQDSTGVERFAVRSGTYPDLISASKAANALAAQTGEFVVVRPAGRL